MADGARLARAAAPLDGDGDVELLRRLREQQGLLDDHLQDLVREVVVERAPVDLDLARARAQEDARRGGLAAARAVVLELVQSSLLVGFPGCGGAYKAALA